MVADTTGLAGSMERIEGNQAAMAVVAARMKEMVRHANEDIAAQLRARIEAAGQEVSDDMEGFDARLERDGQ